ncbi:MAG TPA: ShlB/FhaC/HecB family hemolysin secretion/activation protein [Chthoniobacteraceae bacterium]|jgi:hemolysin activation/secretion protein|nr:ShlB/FhaC/HecB family hemolysin secretion/activation protein [Chthoniobacteraceae bacterium]
MPAPPAEEPGGTLAPAAPLAKLYIREYRITGVKKLSPLEAGEAVYPFLGPERTAADVEQARSALEAAYHEKGFQTVIVEVPEQTGRGGIIVLKAVEQEVGRLRVRGARYFDLERIKRAVPSVSPGSVPNFNALTQENLALNKWPDRRVTPSLRPGVEPGTVDIDLTVEDKLPLHGSVELNNRYSADTTPLRLSASANYGNLWQLGHAVGFTYLTAPERRDDSEIFSAYYLLRLPKVDGLTLIFQGTKQTSNITSNNIGSVTVAAPGQTLGVRANISLPAGKNFYQSVSLGLDYKHYEESVLLGGVLTASPLTYWPLSATYDGTWAGKGYTTSVNLAGVAGLRGAGSSPAEFELKRHASGGNFAYVHGELSDERDVGKVAQTYARVQGQLASQALVNTEQVAGGGSSTVRGYLESEVLGDNGIFATVELRTPSLLGWVKPKGNEWRFYAFADGGYVSVRDSLPGQEKHYRLASAGVGSSLRLLDHLNGSIDLAMPLISQSETKRGDGRVNFRVWADF